MGAQGSEVKHSGGSEPGSGRSQAMGGAGMFHHLEGRGVPVETKHGTWALTKFTEVQGGTSSQRWDWRTRKGNQ